MIKSDTENWSSSFAFLLAAVGSAVGLGTIWRFSYVVGENGGGGFVLIYLLLILTISIPATVGSIVIGRSARVSPGNAFASLANTRKPFWHGVGWLIVLVSFAALTYFSVVASWVIAYVVQSINGSIAQITPQTAKPHFDDLLSSPNNILGFHAAFIAMNVIPVALGVRAGLEALTKLLIPLLVGLMAALIVYAIVYAEFSQGLAFLFRPDFSKIGYEAVLLAFGQALFTLGVGGSGMIAYGAYLPENVNIFKAVGIIAVADTIIAITAGLIIFPFVFEFGLAPGSGPNLIFVTLPTAFAQLPGGQFVSLAFFLLLLFAALTTSVAMLEPFVSWMAEKTGLGRTKLTIASGFLAWLIGLFSLLSFNVLSAVRPLGFFPIFEDMTIFRTLDYLVANIFLPFCAFLIILFAGWCMSEATLRQHLTTGQGTGFIFIVWRGLMRFVLPVVIIVIFCTNLL